MNKAGNRRYYESRVRMEAALLQVLDAGDEPSVKRVCSLAEVSRSTFYEHYHDIADMLDHVGARLRNECMELLGGERADNALLLSQTFFLTLLRHMATHRSFYRTQLRAQGIPVSFVCLDDESGYAVEFFGAGLEKVIARWLGEDCATDPKTLSAILAEYAPRNLFVLPPLDDPA